MTWAIPSSVRNTLILRCERKRASKDPSALRRAWFEARLRLAPHHEEFGLGTDSPHPRRHSRRRPESIFISPFLWVGDLTTASSPRKRGSPFLAGTVPATNRDSRFAGMTRWSGERSGPVGELQQHPHPEVRGEAEPRRTLGDTPYVVRGSPSGSHLTMRMSFARCCFAPGHPLRGPVISSPAQRGRGTMRSMVEGATPPPMCVAAPFRRLRCHLPPLRGRRSSRGEKITCPRPLALHLSSPHPAAGRAIMTSGRQGEIGGPEVVPVPGGCGYRDPDDKRIDRPVGCCLAHPNAEQRRQWLSCAGRFRTRSKAGLCKSPLPDKPIASARLSSGRRSREGAPVARLQRRKAMRATLEWRGLTFCGLPAPGRSLADAACLMRQVFAERSGSRRMFSLVRIER
jgi:hypothetical protein